MSNQKDAVTTTVESMSSTMTHTHVQSVTLGLKASAINLIANSAVSDQPNPMNPNPTCENDCRFHYGMSMTTAMYFPPVYDKHGNNLNPDGNYTSSTVKCATCSKEWTSSTQHGKTDFKEV